MDEAMPACPDDARNTSVELATVDVHPSGGCYVRTKLNLSKLRDVPMDQALSSWFTKTGVALYLDTKSSLGLELAEILAPVVCN